MSTPDLATVIDRCLDDLVAGRVTVSECLARYPEHRAALEPLLLAAAAMQTLPRPAERTPDRVRRAQFMELIRETPQERRSWIPAIAGMFGGALLPRFAAAAVPVVLAVALGTFLLVSQPAATVSASTLTVFAGTTEEQVDGGWRPLADGASVRQGARLRTDAEGYALLTFADGSTSSLDPSTEIAIERLADGPTRDVQIRQFSGRLWNDVVSDSRAGARYVVLTQDATVQVVGTVFETSVDNGQTSVSTSQGQVDVLVGDERVSVPSGQIVRAQAQAVAERAPVQRAGSLTVDAPFAAALVSERGEATGARADGAIFRQIRGVTTTNPGDGPQRFEFHRLPPGDYTLLLQRFEQGAGDVVLSVDGQERRVPIDASSGAAQLRVRVDLRDGRPRVAIADDTPRPAPTAELPAVRVVETERTRKIQDIVAQRAAAARRAASPPATRATGATGATRDTVPSASGGQAQPPADPFVQRLREATSRNDAAAIRALLAEVAATADTNEARARLVTVVAVLNNEQVAERVTAALDSEPALRARLLDRGDAVLSGELQQRLRRGLALEGATVRPAPAITPPRLPSPVRTPTPTASSPRAAATATPATSAATPGVASATATGAGPTATPGRTVTPPRVVPTVPPLPTAVDGFGIRLRVALGTRNDEAIRRALADVVDSDAAVTRARLAVLAAAVEDRETASRVRRALEGSNALRTSLLRAVDAEAPGETALRAILAAPVPAPTATDGTNATR